MLTTVMLTAAPRAAHACSCMELDLSKYVNDDAIVFVGTQLERVVHDDMKDNGVTLLLSVERVYSGEAGPLIEVRTNAQGGACGVDLYWDGEVGVVAQMWLGELSVNSCTTPVPVDALEEVFGEGRPPDESIRLPVSPDSRANSSNANLSLDENEQAAPTTSSPDLAERLLATLLIAAVAAIVVAAAVVWNRRR